MFDIDIDVDGLEGVERWTLGIGIIDRLGGRGGGPALPDTPVEVVLNVGENARCINVVNSSSSPPASDEPLPGEHLDGAGM